MPAIIAAVSAVGSIIPAFFMLIYFACVIGIIIYMIRLFIRLVKAVERIADSVDNCCQSKTSQPD